MKVTDPGEEIKSFLGCIVVPLIFLLLGLVAVMLTAYQRQAAPASLKFKR